jgi:DNA-binding Lrp family transcriptional regulator
MQNSRAPIDATDERLLELLQRNAHLTSEALGRALNLSPSQAGRRRQRLEAAGLITGYAARLDASALGLAVQAFVQVQMATHKPDLVATFARMVSLEPRITSAFTLTGEADYLLRVFCRDLAALNELIHERILPHPAVARVQSQIVMDQMKPDAPLPV